MGQCVGIQLSGVRQLPKPSDALTRDGGPLVFLSRTNFTELRLVQKLLAGCGVPLTFQLQACHRHIFAGNYQGSHCRIHRLLV